MCVCMHVRERASASEPNAVVSACVRMYVCATLCKVHVTMGCAHKCVYAPCCMRLRVRTVAHNGCVCAFVCVCMCAYMRVYVCV